MLCFCYVVLFNAKKNVSIGCLLNYQPSQNKHGEVYSNLVPRPSPPPVFVYLQYAIIQEKTLEILSCAVVLGRQRGMVPDDEALPCQMAIQRLEA